MKNSLNKGPFSAYQEDPERDANLENYAYRSLYNSQ